MNSLFPESERLVESAGRRCHADSPSPQLLAYATTKGAIQNFTGGLAQLLAERGIRVNCVAPVYVMRATDEASYVLGATVAVTGGKPIL